MDKMKARFGRIVEEKMVTREARGDSGEFCRIAGVYVSACGFTQQLQEGGLFPLCMPHNHSIRWTLTAEWAHFGAA